MSGVLKRPKIERKMSSKLSNSTSVCKTRLFALLPHFYLSNLQSNKSAGLNSSSSALFPVPLLPFAESYPNDNSLLLTHSHFSLPYCQRSFWVFSHWPTSRPIVSHPTLSLIIPHCPASPLRSSSVSRCLDGSFSISL